MAILKGHFTMVTPVQIPTEDTDGVIIKMSASHSLITH